MLLAPSEGEGDMAARACAEAEEDVCAQELACGLADTDARISSELRFCIPSTTWMKRRKSWATPCSDASDPTLLPMRMPRMSLCTSRSGIR